MNSIVEEGSATSGDIVDWQLKGEYRQEISQNPISRDSKFNLQITEFLREMYSNSKISYMNYFFLKCQMCSNNFYNHSPVKFPFFINEKNKYVLCLPKRKKLKNSENVMKPSSFSQKRVLDSEVCTRFFIINGTQTLKIY